MQGLAKAIKQCLEDEETCHDTVNWSNQYWQILRAVEGEDLIHVQVKSLTTAHITWCAYPKEQEGVMNARLQSLRKSGPT